MKQYIVTICFLVKETNIFEGGGWSIITHDSYNNDSRTNDNKNSLSEHFFDFITSYHQRLDNDYLVIKTKIIITLKMRI